MFRLMLAVVVAAVAVSLAEGAAIPKGVQLTDFRTEADLEHLLFGTPFLKELLRCAPMPRHERINICHSLVNQAADLLPDVARNRECPQCTESQKKILRRALVMVNRRESDTYQRLSEIFSAS